MHFVKTVVSLFALSGFAAAQYADPADGLSRRELEVAHEEYLAARDEYIEKRELFLRGPQGVCRRTPAGALACMLQGHGCGSCPRGAKVGDPCHCTKGGR